MNIKALITMLALGTSSVAVAEPVLFQGSARATLSFGNPPSPAPIVRDHRVVNTRHYFDRGYELRYDDRFHRPSNVKLNADSSEYVGPIFRPQSRWGWSAMTEPTRIEKTRQIFNLNTRLRGLMLENTVGSSYIRLVKIRYTTGEDETIMINQTLDAHNRWIVIDPARSDIAMLVVYGTTHRGSSYRVHGS